MPERLVDINLLPKYDRKGEGSSVLFFLFLILTLAAFIAIGVFYYIINNNLSDLESKYENLQAEEETLQAELASLDIAEGETLKHSVQFAERQIVETSSLITTLDDLLPRNGSLNQYTYRTNETSISAHLSSLDRVAEYTAELTASDLFTDAKLTKVSAVLLEGEEDEEESDTSYYEANFLLQVDRQMLKKGDED